MPSRRALTAPRRPLYMVAPNKNLNLTLTIDSRKMNNFFSPMPKAYKLIIWMVVVLLVLVVRTASYMSSERDSSFKPKDLEHFRLAPTVSSPDTFDAPQYSTAQRGAAADVLARRKKVEPARQARWHSVDRGGQARARKFRDDLDQRSPGCRNPSCIVG